MTMHEPGTFAHEEVTGGFRTVLISDGGRDVNAKRVRCRRSAATSPVDFEVSYDSTAEHFIIVIDGNPAAVQSVESAVLQLEGNGQLTVVRSGSLIVDDEDTILVEATPDLSGTSACAEVQQLITDELLALAAV